MIQTLKAIIDNREFTLHYPHSPVMEQAIRDIFQAEYPFLPFLKDRPGFILDIGANIGCVSVLFRAFYPRSTIFAFEPNRETFDFLCSNTSGLGDFRAFPFGLFDRDCTARLYRGKGASVTNSLGRSPFNSEDSEEVALRRISSVLDEQGIERINLLKIDTEGAEVPILRDIEDRLDRVEAIIVEYHSERDRREIDHLLSARFHLVGGKIHRCHLGVLAYVAQEIIAAEVPWEKLAIARPQL